jgi:pyruvate/2-oxoglutarate dehydrogenase complex dihydrolipoamide acyltransferase (E2) component
MNDLSAPPPRAADPAVYGDGLARVLDAVAQRMPKAEVEAVWSFPGVRREGREHGVAVVTRKGAGDRHIVYRVRYVLELKGQARGQLSVVIAETAEAPADLLPRVIDGVRDRADEAGDAEVVDLTAWKRDDGHGAA